MEKVKLWHRIKYRNSVTPIENKVKKIKPKHRHPAAFYVSKMKRKSVKEQTNIVQLKDNDIQEFCQKCPSTAMSRLMEKMILGRVQAKGLEKKYRFILNEIMSDAKKDFLIVTQQSGVEMKIQTEKKYQITKYKNLGRTSNYPVFLQRRKELGNKFILHLPLIRRILRECVEKLPQNLVDLNLCVKNQLSAQELQKFLLDCAHDALQRLQEFYRKIVGFVETDKSKTESYLRACTTLFSVNLSQSLAQTLKQVVKFTESKEHVPFLKLKITYKNGVVLEPMPDDVIAIFELFLTTLIDSASQFYGFDGEKIHLCLTPEFLQQIQCGIRGNIVKKFVPVFDYIKNLDNDFVGIYDDLNVGDTFVSDLVFDEACERLLYYKAFLPKIAFVSDNAYFVIGQLVMIEYRETLNQMLLSIINNIFSSLSSQHEWETNDICESFDIIYLRARLKPTTTEEVIEIGKYMTWVRNEYLIELKERVVQALVYLTKLIQLGPLKENHILMNSKATNWLDAILPILEENATNFEQLKFEAEEKLQRVVEDINIDIKAVYPLLDILDSMDNIENVRNYLNSITLHMVKIKSIEDKIDWINQEETSLSFPKSTYSEFDELKNYVYPFYHLLKLSLDVRRNVSVWLDGQFDLIKYDDVKETVERYNRELLMTQKLYRNKLRQAQDENLSLRFKGTVDDPDMLNWPAPLKLCSKAIKLIQDFEPLLSVIKIMCNEALMQRHWKKMSQVAGFDITPNAGTTLRKIMELDLKTNIVKYEHISSAASKEKKLLDNLKGMLAEWQHVNFTIDCQKTTPILVQMEEIQTLSEDHTIKAINMLKSIYVKPYLNQVNDFHSKLSKITQTIDECHQLQTKLLEFNPFFASKQISNQLQTSDQFAQISTTYFSYIKTLQIEPNVYTTVNSTNILQDLLKCNEHFQIITQSVNRYFNQIRIYFPRFYFVSNNELFHILSLTKSPHKIDRFIKNLFNGIKALKFASNDIINALVSDGNEVFKLNEGIDTKTANGCVEIWLKKLTDEMKKTLVIITKEEIKEHKEDCPQQVTLLVKEIQFTSKTTKAIEENTLKQYQNEIDTENLQLIDKMIEVEANTKRVILTTALIASKNHSNVISILIDNHCNQLKDFNWVSKLRYYYFDPNINVQIFDITRTYGNEYLGDATQIIMTKSMERSYHSLILTYKYGLCAHLHGLNGTGKTTTIKALGKAFGIQCTFFKCSAIITINTLFEFLKGVTINHWLVLEEFDKLTPIVSSSLSHQLSMSLIDDYQNKGFLFCTTTTNYQMTESVRALFRPIFLSKPDYQTLAQVILFASGYQNYNILASALITTAKLTKNLLSTTIDIISILRQCQFKSLIIRDVIYKMTVTKLSKTQVLVFEQILMKLFPASASGENEIIASCRSLSFEVSKSFIEKLKELEEIMSCKSGIIIVGQTFTGKTSLVQDLRKRFVGSTIDVKFVNAASLNLWQLFGRFVKGQWRDGLITNFLRQGFDKWIVFDGPSIGEWTTEIMSLIEDQQLFLASGEVLNLVGNNKIVFEVDDLSNTSPAMISRCGIIYLEPNTIGWKPLLTQWLHTFDWQKGSEETLTTLFDWTIPPCLDFLQNCHQLCKVNQISLVKTTVQILEMFLNEAYELILKKEEDPKNFSFWIQASLIQAIIWGLGSNLDLEDRSKFDEFFKQLWRGQNKDHPHPSSLEKIEVGVPSDELIFDHCYLYKAKGNWKFWHDILKNEKIDDDELWAEIFVPTIDTLKYSMMINMHILYGYPMLLVGPTGTGKTIIIWENLMKKIDKNLYKSLFLTFTSKTDIKSIREIILSSLLKQKSGRYSPGQNKKGILFIDDFSEPISSLEVVRELLDHKHWFNCNTYESLYIDNVNILAAMTTNSNNNQMCQRLLRHFNVFSINPLQDESVCRIFSNVLLTKLRKLGFPGDIQNIVNQLIAATLHFYKSIFELKPKITWNFYQFHLKHFTTITLVCGMIKKDSADANKKLFYKLWIHEISRLVSDRLLDEHQNWFFEIIKYCTEAIFKEDLFENQTEDLSDLMFSAFDNHFDEIDIDKLKEIAEPVLGELKSDTVLFDYALKLLSKVCRTLSIPCSNLVLVGMCGTGRSTIVKLATLILNQKLFRLKVGEIFDICAWHTTVKAVLKEAGGFDKPCTLFIKEEEITSEQILDDLEYILKIGHVPFVFTLNEQQEILDIVRDNMKQSIDDNPQMIFLYFQKRVRQNLHIIISFNPLNEMFRNCLSPTIIKFCDISYVKEWPLESFKDIAKVWLQDLAITEKSNLVNLFSTFHDKIKTLSDNIPVTNRSYLEFVRLYVTIIKDRELKISDNKEKYLSALEKLSFAAVQIAEMQNSLADYQPQLEAMTKQAVEMAKEIESETNEVEKVSALVKTDEKIANEQAAAAQILKLDCEADLAQAIPILEDAISALNTLKPTDITLVKSMKNPPDAIKLVMAAVCVIKDVKPDRIPDPSTGRKIIDYWGPSKRILGDMNFLQTLKDFDKDNIKPEIMVKIRKDYLPHKDFKPHTVAKASSAAEGLCKWIIAMDMYDNVAKEVAPKKEKLEKAEREYKTTVAILNEKKEQVSRIEQKLADLNALLKEATRKQQKLQRDVDNCKRKLNRARKLIDGLSEEKIRWTDATNQFENEFDNLPGDILLSSAIIAYFGPLHEIDRQKVLSIWLKDVAASNIPFNINYDFVGAFDSYVDLDLWHLNGLLGENFYAENGIIGMFSKRWILFIDPQHQASHWIKTNEKQNGIKSTKFNNPDYINVLKECITVGNPLLIENLQGNIQPFLLNLITKTTFYQNEEEYIEINGDIINYNKNFKLYLTTNLKYTKYPSEMYDKFTIIEFGMNIKCMKQHLLICVTEYEKPTLRKIKSTLNNEQKRYKDTLKNIEQKILQTLSESKIDILEDENALQVLDESKILSKQIEAKQEALIPLSNTLKDFRDDYYTVAAHSTSLYFTVYQLTKLNHMYQFSYAWFLETFLASIQKAHKYKNLIERRQSFIDTLTYLVYTKICRSIFEKDKLFFSFLLCTNLLLSNGTICLEDVNAFNAIDTMITNKEVHELKWLPKEIWNKLCEVLPNITKNEEALQLIFDSKLPEQEQFPDFCNPFTKLILIKVMRPDRIFQAIKIFVTQQLSIRYTKPPSFDLTCSFEESYILSPLLFIEKQGSNPITALKVFAKTKNFENKLKIISISNNDEFDIALIEAQKLGLWICVKNCHLFPSWLAHLDLKLDDIDYSNTHENFRLWLTTNETNSFPITLLERSIKIIKEPSEGIKNKLMDLYLQEPIKSKQFYTNCPGRNDSFVKFLYRLSYLYCSFQERQKFGWFGWENPYQFHENDFVITIYELQSIIKDINVPFDHIINLVECNYGSQIIDLLDSRLFHVIVEYFLKNDINVPTKTDHQDFVKHISELPEIDTCDVFGLHENYERLRGLKLSKTFIKDDLICISKPVEVVEEVLAQMPAKVDLHLEHTIINSILFEEVKTLNRIISTIVISLKQLQIAFSSHSLLTEELEEIFDSIGNNKVPRQWLPNITSNSLSTCIKNLIARTDYFKKFESFTRQTICLGNFFKPKAFLTAIFLYFSDNLSIPLETLSIALKNGFDSINTVSIDNLFITGANWNDKTETLEELPPKIIYQRLNKCYFMFTKPLMESTFECPLYQNINCFKNNSLENLIWSSILLKSEKCIKHWIRRRTSLFCQEF